MKQSKKNPSTDTVETVINMAANCRVPQQEGADTSIRDMDYFDIMVIGKTGQGKSTTADKLLIANPERIDYTETKIVGDNQTMQDLLIWWLPDDPDAQERITTRLGNLVHYRTSEAPHVSVTNAHASCPVKGQPGMAVNRRTLKCELFSNETTKVRILDVPGFFSAIPRDVITTKSPAAATANQADLGTMRRIIRIQTIMQMRFKRILYFLPNRDTLELSDSAFQQELQLMYTHFGRAIFEVMVLVATLGPTTYKIVPESSPVEMPVEELDQTRSVFQEALRAFLPEDTPSPPIIFISLRETCESILQKVKSARVFNDSLQLEFSSSVCARCGMTIGIHTGEKTVCTYGEDWSEAVDYGESHCHPILVPKYSPVEKFRKRVAAAVKGVLVKRQWRWPELDDEICHFCQLEPGSKGCKAIKSKVNWQGTEIAVDHTHSALEGIEIEQEESQQHITTSDTTTLQNPPVDSGAHENI